MKLWNSHRTVGKFLKTYALPIYSNHTADKSKNWQMGLHQNLLHIEEKITRNKRRPTEWEKKIFHSSSSDTELVYVSIKRTQEIKHQKNK
jgi:hypothetical protein